MVIVYRDMWRAVAAQRALSKVGIRTRCAPEQLKHPIRGPGTTHLIAQRLTVPSTDAERARAVLVKYGLLNWSDECHPGR